MSKELNGYELSRAWFDFAFEHPNEIKPNHAALFFFAIEHCNRLGWKQKFGLPTSMAMEAIGVKSYNTYKDTLTDLVKWGFIKMVEKSTNQWSSNIVALSKFDKSLDKALDKALAKHLTNHGRKQGESTSESIDSINKPLTKEPLTKEQTNNGDVCDGSDSIDVEDNFQTSDLSKKILQDFGFNEINNFDKLRIISTALREIIETDRMDYFSQQYRDYWSYKKLSNEKTHNLPAFFGDPPGWDSANWSEKLKSLTPPGKEGKILTNLKRAATAPNPFR